MHPNVNKYFLILTIYSFGSFSNVLHTYPAFKTGSYIVRPLQQNIDGGTVEQVAGLCETYKNLAGKAGSILGTDCSIQATYRNFFRYDENGIKVLFGLYNIESKALMGVVTFDYMSTYLILKNNIMLPLEDLSEVAVSLVTYLKYIKVAPYFLSLLKNPEQRFPETSGVGVNKGGFRILFGDEANYWDVQFPDKKHTEFEVCSFSGWSRYTCPEELPIRFLTGEEEAAFAVPSKSFFIIIETKISKKHLVYINNSSEIVNLYELPFDSGPNNRQTNTPTEKYSDKIIGSATQNIQVFNVTIRSNNHNFTQVR